jgi:acetyltransferase EpsM
MREKIVIWGTSGHAKVVFDIINLMNKYEIVGFLDDINAERHGSQFCGFPILGGREQLDGLRRDGVSHVIFGFGNCEARLKLAELARAQGFILATAIHPRTIIAEDVSIGEGSVIVAGVVVNPGARIGENVIINTLASVDHECVVEDGAHICPGVHLAGKVTVGRASWLGIGVIVMDKIRIGAGAIIGAGAVVVKDIPDGVLAYGVPAKEIKRIGKDGY